jgi:hypothetical protein
MLEQLFYSGPSIGVLHEEYAKKGRVDENAGKSVDQDHWADVLFLYLFEERDVPIHLDQLRHLSALLDGWEC